MEIIGINSLWSFLEGGANAVSTGCTQIRKGPGCFVTSYLDLAKKVAELQFRNGNQILFFRGQSADYPNKQKNSTLKPSLFRPINKGNPTSETLSRRFELLETAEKVLVEEYTKAKHLGFDRLARHRIIRWSILQHYEICKTPLLDVTHSLRIAASFATQQGKDEGYIFVVGVPHLSGGITASAEAGIQTVRLASVCPPSAMRPHIQEGYLLGEYPEMAEFSQKEHYYHYEIDFGRRLVAKFRFTPSSFWQSETFPRIPLQDLYPPEESDPLQLLARRVKTIVGEVA